MSSFLYTLVPERRTKPPEKMVHHRQLVNSPETNMQHARTDFREEARKSVSDKEEGKIEEYCVHETAMPPPPPLN